MLKLKVTKELIKNSLYANIQLRSFSVYDIRMISNAHLKSCFSSRKTSCRSVYDNRNSIVTGYRTFAVSFSSVPRCVWQRRSISSKSTLQNDTTLEPELEPLDKTKHVLENKKSESSENLDITQAVTDQDVDEELLRYDYENFEEISTDSIGSDQIISKNPLPISLERGKTGVFDVEELVVLLEDENAKDVRVLPVPPEYHYVDYLVVATGRSTRHLRAMAEFIKWMYKRKHSPDDPPSVKIEGEQTKDWFAIDLGNIAVHLFLHDTRVHYDLETLWTVGYEADDLDSVGDEATIREDFSFDTELERLRKLKGSRYESGNVSDGKPIKRLEQNTFRNSSE